MAETQEEKRRRLIQEGMAARKAAGQGVKKVGAGLSSAAVATAQGLNAVGETLIVNPQLRVAGFVAGDFPAPPRSDHSGTLKVGPAVTPRPSAPAPEQHWTRPYSTPSDTPARGTSVSGPPSKAARRGMLEGAFKPESDPLNPPKPMPRNLLELALRLAPAAPVRPEPNPLDPKPAQQPATPAAPSREDTLARIAFAKELKASARTGGYDPAQAQEQARSLNISPEDFARFAKRESLGDLQVQQERQMVNPIGSSSALNMRQSKQTEAGRLISLGRRYKVPELYAQGVAMKANTPNIRTQDQRIAEQEGQEKTAAAFQANEDQYAGLMKQMAGDPKGRRILDKWMKKNQAQAS